MIELNYRNKVDSIRKLISNWQRRSISTIGRITVVKSLLLPKLVHFFMSLPDPSQKFLAELNTIFFHYIWNSKVDRIARKIITKDYREGGLKMVNLSFFLKSLKITWIRRIVNSNSSWCNMLKDILPDSFKFFPNLGNKYLEKIMTHVNPF